MNPREFGVGEKPKPADRRDFAAANARAAARKHKMTRIVYTIPVVFSPFFARVASTRRVALLVVHAQIHM